MKLGKVIGNVVATIKDPGLKSLRLLVVQGLDDNFKPSGKPYVAADGIETAGPGDIVYIVSKKEAAIVFPEELVPIDECIVGYVEEYYVTKKALKKPSKKKAPPPTLEPPVVEPPPIVEDEISSPPPKIVEKTPPKQKIPTTTTTKSKSPTTRRRRRT